MSRLIPQNFWVSFLLVTTLVFLLSACNQTRHDWAESYRLESKEPYGLKVCHDLLEAYFPGKGLVPVEADFSILLKEEGPSNYVFIGEGYLFSEEEKAILKEYLSNGNRVLLITKSGVVDLLEYLDIEECGTFIWQAYQTTFVYDTIAYMSFSASGLAGPEAEYPVRFYKGGRPFYMYQWPVLPDSYGCDSLGYPAVLGYLEDRPNFIQMDGDEPLLLHSTPLAFTNFSLLEEEGVAYAERVFSYLQAGPIYWETQRQVSEEVVQSKNTPGAGLPGKSPLSYILSQPSLATAWYLLLFLVLLYLIFRAKRRQRIIPVAEANENTSLEFVNTIGKLYFQKGNPREVALQKMRFLQAAIRDRYQIKNKEWTDEILHQIHQKSEVDRILLEKIRTMYQNISTSRLTTEKTLTDFHFLLADFYRQRK
jgi:hypothetical protein